MQKIETEVPEGKYCFFDLDESDGCVFLDNTQRLNRKTGKDVYKCICTAFTNKKGKWFILKGAKNDTTLLKCPACLVACQQYKDEHDYEKAREAIRREITLNRLGGCTDEITAREILKALGYKEVKG